MVHRLAPEARGAPISRQIAALFGAAALVAVVVFSHGAPAHAAELAPWTQGALPAFTLPDTYGTDVALNAEPGKAVLVHFFATWCEPCRDELPSLARLAERSDGKLKVIAISVAEVDLRVQRFLQTIPLPFPVLLDRDRAVARAWQVATLPTTFVLDPRLRPTLFVESDLAWDKTDPKQLIEAIPADNGPGRPHQKHLLVQQPGGT